MTALFCAHKMARDTIPAYLIESTAPNNVDDSSAAHARMPPGLQPLDPDKAITEIVDHLFAADDPNLVITIHGYNNPQRVVLSRTEKVL
jgi:hypothetical protein